MQKFDGRDRRRFFRLRYPGNETPFVITLGKVYDITEISEQGLRFSAPGVLEFKLGQEFFGRLDLHMGRSFEVFGKVLRIEKTEIIVVLTKGIPMQVVVEEQRYLINKYPRR